LSECFRGLFTASEFPAVWHTKFLRVVLGSLAPSNQQTPALTAGVHSDIELGLIALRISGGVAEKGV